MRQNTLSDGEWKLMNLLWQEGGASLGQMVEALREDTGWSKATVNIMLGRLAKVLGAEFSGPAKAYTDRAQISPYAVPGVDFVSGLGIMNGNANGSFSPQANITREEAVITVMNAWRNIDKHSPDSEEQPESEDPQDDQE